jgi:hypothetical protein
MSNQADAFKNLVSARKAKDEEPPVDAAASQSEPDNDLPEATVIDFPQAAPKPAPQPKKRGRPATGKRSTEGWTGRTFYIEQENDLDVEEELMNLKRNGVELDKSELVNSLLAAWVKWRQGDKAEILLSKISPRRK